MPRGFAVLARRADERRALATIMHGEARIPEVANGPVSRLRVDGNRDKGRASPESVFTILAVAIGARERSGTSQRAAGVMIATGGRWSRALRCRTSPAVLTATAVTACRSPRSVSGLPVVAAGQGGMAWRPRCRVLSGRDGVADTRRIPSAPASSGGVIRFDAQPSRPWWPPEIVPRKAAPAAASAKKAATACSRWTAKRGIGKRVDRGANRATSRSRDRTMSRRRSSGSVPDSEIRRGFTAGTRG